MIVFDEKDDVKYSDRPSFDDVYNHQRTGCKLPVFYETEPSSAGWYWCDEIWDCHGPYQTKQDAVKDLNDYCRINL